MAPRCKDPHAYDRDYTDGGEATPRPHKAQRLVDVMDGAGPRAKGRAEQTLSVSERPTQAPFREAKKQPPARRASAVSCGAETPPPPVVPPAAPDGYAVLSVTPEGEGATVAVILSVPAGEVERVTEGKDSGEDGRPAKLKLRLLVEQYTELKPCAGEITPDEAELLLDAARLCGAIRRGMSLLQYGDQSARRLAYKLTSKGINRETAARAADYLVERGYIREDNAATLRAEQNARKLWGPRRIREDLGAQGFSREAVDEAMESLSEVDWEENCAAAIRKKYGEVPADRAERQKLIAAIMRLGYDADTVREAMRTLLRE